MTRFLIFLIGFLILTRFNIDPDLGWHLAMGGKFLDEGRIIRIDEFSWTMQGFYWGNSYFLYQILVAWLFKYLPFWTIAVIFGLVATISFFLLLPRKVNLTVLLLVGLACGLASTNLGIRPHVFDLLFFAILLISLEKRLFIRKLFLPIWFLFFALWANFHVGFLVGLFVLASFLSIDYLKKFKFRWEDSIKARIAVFFLAFAGTFFTPFHFDMWKSIIFDSGNSLAYQYIAEFQPVVVITPLNLLYGLSGVIFLYIFLKNSRKISREWFLIAALIFTLPFISVFFVLFWSAILVFFCSRHLKFIFFEKFTLTKFPAFFALVSVILTIFLTFVTNIAQSLSFNGRLRLDGYPREALEYMKQNNLTSNIFNNYNWGGYMDWQYPGLSVFIDGRMAGWRRADGSYILSDYLRILKEDCEVASRYDIEVVLVEKSINNKCFSDFAEIYRDSVAKVLVRN